MSSEAGCPHATADRRHRVCSHILENPEASNLEYAKRFTGVGKEYELLCPPCAWRGADADPFLRDVCAACFARIDDDRNSPQVRGRPETLTRLSKLRFGHQLVEVPLLADEEVVDLRPFDDLPGNRWVALTKSGKLAAINLATGEASILGAVADSGVDLDKRMSLRLSPDGRYGAVVNVYGRRGVVLDLTNSAVRLTLDRGERGAAPFPIAFAARGGQTILIHATARNRLDVTDPATGERPTDRPAAAGYTKQKPPHYLDFWHGELSVSPDGERIASFGWVWHPNGVISVWSLRRWLEENIWESEDGPSKVEFLHIPYFWDAPYCWIDGRTIAVWGYGFDAKNMIPGVRLFDAVAGKERHWFPGPDVAPYDPPNPVAENWQPLFFDRFLFSVSKTNGTAIWDVTTGERLHHDAEFRPDSYHRGCKQFVTARRRGNFRVSRLVE